MMIGAAESVSVCVCATQTNDDDSLRGMLVIVARLPLQSRTRFCSVEQVWK